MAEKAKVYLMKRPADVSSETILALEELLREARAGNVQGLAYVALHAGAAMSHDVLGRCRLSPVLTAGMALSLLRDVEKLV